MTQLCAVLTGDLVDSTKADGAVVEQAFEALMEAGEAVRSFDAGGAPALNAFAAMAGKALYLIQAWPCGRRSF